MKLYSIDILIPEKFDEEEIENWTGKKPELFFTSRYLQNVEPKKSNQQEIHIHVGCWFSSWIVAETCYLSDVSSDSMEYFTNANSMHILITIT